MCNAQIELEVLYRLPLPWRPPSAGPQPPEAAAQVWLHPSEGQGRMCSGLSLTTYVCLLSAKLLNICSADLPEGAYLQLQDNEWFEVMEEIAVGAHEPLEAPGLGN
jgi:hypothetical protein